MKKLLVLFSVSLLFTVSGCAWFENDGKKMEKTAEQLIKEGLDEFKDENYRNAIKSFTTLRDWYPFSKYAILAELKIADAHFELDDYEEAIFAYQEFERLHPKNEAIPYIIYRRAMCWYDQIKSVDKDQTPAKKALEQFNRLKKSFPDTVHASKAQKRLQKCIENLAGHEEYIANFYLKSQHYKAAIKRFEYLFEIYPDTKPGRKAPERIAYCKKMMKKNET